MRRKPQWLMPFFALVGVPAHLIGVGIGTCGCGARSELASLDDPRSGAAAADASAPRGEGGAAEDADASAEAAADPHSVEALLAICERATVNTFVFDPVSHSPIAATFRAQGKTVPHVVTEATFALDIRDYLVQALVTEPTMPSGDRWGFSLTMSVESIAKHFEEKRYGDTLPAGSVGGPELWGAADGWSCHQRGGYFVITQLRWLKVTSALVSITAGFELHCNKDILRGCLHLQDITDGDRR